MAVAMSTLSTRHGFDALSCLDDARDDHRRESRDLVRITVTSLLFGAWIARWAHGRAGVRWLAWPSAATLD